MALASAPNLESAPSAGSPALAIQSPNPHRPGLPGANSEPTSTLSHLLARGLYPNPGLYDSMRRQNPAIDSAMTARYYRRHAKPFRLLTRQGLSQQAVDRAGRVREQLQSTYDGINGIAAELGDRADQFGAGIAERVLEADSRGEFRLADWVWVESWTIYRVYQDAAGFPVALQLRGARNVSAAGGLGLFAAGQATSSPGLIGTGTLTDPLPMSLFGLFARRGNSRLPEGHAALRCLYWRTEDIRHMLTNAALARDRAGLPKRRYRVPLAQIDSPDLRSAIAANELRLARTEERYSIEPAEIDVLEDEGPRLMPGYGEAIRAHEHAIARQLGDTLSEEGVAVQGARAAVVEQRKSAELSDLGQDLAIARAMTREIIRPIYEANGWPLAEMPYVFVTGWPDTDAWRALVEIMREDGMRAANPALPRILADEDYPQIREAARLAFGWGQDHA